MRYSWSSLAVTGISVAQVALASPLTPQKPLKSLHGLGRLHRSYTEGQCEPMGEGHAPKARPDDIWTFKAYKPFETLANSATTPEGYHMTQVNMQAVVAEPDFLGWVSNIQAYDPKICAKACNDKDDCKSFNLMILRYPTLWPNQDKCPNPPSQSVYACALLGELASIPVKKEFLIFSNMWNDFEIVAAGSNVYNKIEKYKRSELDSQKPVADPKQLNPDPKTQAQTPDSKGPSSDPKQPNPQPKKPVSDPKPKCNGAPIIRNGGFEMDDPSFKQTPTGWTITSVKPSVGFGFTKPGSSNNGGTYAFLANLLSPDYSIAQPVMGFTLSTVMNTCPGTKYHASLEYRFDNAAEHRCAISFGHSDGKRAMKKVAESLVVTSVSDNVEGNKPHVWLPLKYNFTAKTRGDLLAVHVQCNGSAWNNYSVDNVEVVEVKK